MITLIILWKILRKASDHGWKLLIPFYSKYTLYKDFHKKGCFWTLLILKLLFLIFAITGVTIAELRVEHYGITLINFFDMLFTYGYCIINPASLLSLSLLLAALVLIPLSICSIWFRACLRYNIPKSFGAKPVHCVLNLFFPCICLFIIAVDERFVYTKRKEEQPVVSEG